MSFGVIKNGSIGRILAHSSQNAIIFCLGFVQLRDPLGTLFHTPARVTWQSHDNHTEETTPRTWHKIWTALSDLSRQYRIHYGVLETRLLKSVEWSIEYRNWASELDTKSRTQIHTRIFLSSTLWCIRYLPAAVTRATRSTSENCKGGRATV